MFAVASRSNTLVLTKLRHLDTYSIFLYEICSDLLEGKVKMDVTANGGGGGTDQSIVRQDHTKPLGKQLAYNSSNLYKITRLDS